MSLFFISYKRQDIEFARKVRQQIQDNGFVGWIDENIRGGEEWKRVIDNAIRDSLGVILIVTPQSLGSQYVTYEWSLALGLGKQVIPVILRHPDPNSDEPQMHPRLGDRHFRDFSKSEIQPWDDLFNDLSSLTQLQLIPPEIQRALEMLQTSPLPNERQAATQALLDHSHPKAVDALATAVGHGNDDVSVQAAIALAKKTDYQEIRALSGLRRAVKRSNYKYHQDAIHALERIGNDEAVQILLEAYPVQGAAADSADKIFASLHRLSHPLSREFFQNVLQKSNSLNERGNAALSLAKLKDTTMLPIMLEMAKKPTDWPAGRKMTIQAIGILGDPAAVEPLIEELDKYPRHLAQEFAEPIVKALVQIGVNEAIDYLQKRRRQYSDGGWLNTVIEANLPRE